MAQTILEFRLDRDKADAIQKICQQLGIRIVSVERRDYGQKLGALAGVKGFVKEKKIYTGAEFPAEMLVFSGMNSLQVDTFLDAYKTYGVAPIALKAIVTAHNVSWSADVLLRELMQEHLSLGKK